MAGVARLRVGTAVVCAALLGCGGGGGGDDARTGETSVTSEVVSDPTTQDVHVFAPRGSGTWPVVVALHGIDGSAEDMGELATRLAEDGMVVFAPSYRSSDLTTPEGFDQAASDIACGYRLARATASEHGGDLTEPVTALGWSLGADFAVLGGLSDPSPDDACTGEQSRPDVVVGISGCYYEYEGKPVTWFDDVSSLGNKDAEVYLLAGEQDTNCPAWQSQQLANALRGAGYHVDYIPLPGADHFAPIFHEVRNGQFKVAANDAAGQRAVQVVVDAIATRQQASSEQ
jgi:dienelactone hydrolase